MKKKKSQKQRKLENDEIFALLKVQFVMPEGMQLHYDFMNPTDHAKNCGCQIWIDEDCNEHQNLICQLDKEMSTKLLKMLFPDFDITKKSKWTEVR